MKSKNFSIIIPTLNECSNIIKLISEIYKKLIKNNFNFEIIVVDDKSKDGIKDKIKKYTIQNNLQNLKFIENKKRIGLSLSVVEGAQNSKYENIIVMDGDGQHDPKDIFQIIEKVLNNNFDLIIGSRYKTEKFTKNLSFLRNLSSKVNNAIIKKLTNKNISDPLTGFFYIRKKLLLKNKFYYGKGFKILFDILLSEKNISFSEIQINFRIREKGKSKLNFKIIIIFLNQLLLALFKYFFK